MLEPIILHAFWPTLWQRKFTRLMLGLEAHRSKFYHLGFGKNISRSNLAKENGKRNYRIFEKLAYHLINEARRVNAIKDFDLNIKSNVYAFDSSTIDLCLSVSCCAEFRKTKGGVKLHTLFDVKTSIPSCTLITKASINDKNALDLLTYDQVDIKYWIVVILIMKGFPGLPGIQHILQHEPRKTSDLI